MLQQAILHTALRFAISYTILEALLLVLSRLMNLNPFGPFRIWPLFMLPLFIIMGIRYLKRFEIAQYLSFRDTFRVGSLISFLGAACSAMLLYVYTILSGPSLIQQHIKQVEYVLSRTKPQLENVMGKGSTDKIMSQISTINPVSLAFDDFFWKLILGLFTSLIFAFFFRSKHKLPLDDQIYGK